MRGKEAAKTKAVPYWRITPAYAGKSILGLSFPSPYEDHPRLCGEKYMGARTHTAVSGSPPPMRGKGHGIREQHILDGITPAYAGKRRVCNAGVQLQEDHPRLCGEKFFGLFLMFILRGSPPPMRGKD